MHSSKLFNYLFPTIFALLILNCDFAVGDTLRYVQAVWRHGDRAPTEMPYQSDQYNESSWPRGWGQLTTVGMKQMHELGEFLHERYIGKFLSDHFDRKEVYVRSTEVDRAIESAQSLLTGMFPPTSDDEQFDANFKWQPIAIHTPGSTKEDALLHPWSHPCPRYGHLLKPIRKENDQKLLEKYKDLVEFARPILGIPEPQPVQMMELMKLRHIKPEIIHNFTQPDWVTQRWPQYGNRTTIEIIWEIRALNWLPDFNGSEDIRKLIGGVMLGDLLGRLQRVAKGEKFVPSKMMLYSSHDNTLLTFLSVLKINEPSNVMELPPYASCIIIELYERENANQFYIKLLYRRDRQLEEMTLDGCTKNCPMKKAIELLEPRAIYGGKGEREKICAPDLDQLPSSSFQSSLWKPIIFLSLIITIFCHISNYANAL